MFLYIGDDWKNHTSHSIRKSVVKWAVRCGGDVIAIMVSGRWSSKSKHFMVYYESGRLELGMSVDSAGKVNDPIFTFWVWQPNAIHDINAMH